MHILFLIQSAFSIWMLIDCVNRGLEKWWYFVILTPGGEIVYFFAVKIKDFKNSGIAPIKRKVKLGDLEYQAKSTPSIHNKVMLAQGLHDSKRFNEGKELFEEVLRNDQNHKEAIYGLSQCLIGLNNINEAIAKLEELVENSFSYSNFKACVDLIDLYLEQSKKEQAIELSDKLSKKSSLIEHQSLFAKLLVESGDKETGRKVLEEALYEYKHSPKYIKKRDKRVAKNAKTLLQSI